MFFHFILRLYFLSHSLFLFEWITKFFILLKFSLKLNTIRSVFCSFIIGLLMFAEVGFIKISALLNSQNEEFKKM